MQESGKVLGFLKIDISQDSSTYIDVLVDHADILIADTQFFLHFLICIALKFK